MQTTRGGAGTGGLCLRSSPPTHSGAPCLVLWSSPASQHQCVSAGPGLSLGRAGSKLAQQTIQPYHLRCRLHSTSITALCLHVLHMPIEQAEHQSCGRMRIANPGSGRQWDGCMLGPDEINNMTPCLGYAGMSEFSFDCIFLFLQEPILYNRAPAPSPSLTGQFWSHSLQFPPFSFTFVGSLSPSALLELIPISPLAPVISKVGET